MVVFLFVVPFVSLADCPSGNCAVGSEKEGCAIGDSGKISEQLPTNDKESAIKMINTEELEKIVSQKSALIFDARTGRWDDGTRIPGAASLSAENSVEEINKAIPNKDQAVVVYCGSRQCPASAKLAKKLVELGYKNIMEYPDGIKGWKESGKEIEKVK